MRPFTTTLILILALSVTFLFPETTQALRREAVASGVDRYWGETSGRSGKLASAIEDIKEKVKDDVFEVPQEEDITSCKAVSALKSSCGHILKRTSKTRRPSFVGTARI